MQNGDLCERRQHLYLTDQCANSLGRPHERKQMLLLRESYWELATRRSWFEQADLLRQGDNAEWRPVRKETTLIGQLTSEIITRVSWFEPEKLTGARSHFATQLDVKSPEKTALLSQHALKFDTQATIQVFRNLLLQEPMEETGMRPLDTQDLGYTKGREEPQGC